MVNETQREKEGMREKVFSVCFSFENVTRQKHREKEGMREKVFSVCFCFEW